MIYENYIRVLYVDMATSKITIKNREDLQQYLGGVGVAAKLLEENMHPELPPLDPAQPIVFAIGALSTIYPVMTKTVAMFISPLTGELGESYAGGRLAMTLFNAGFDAVVITGKAQRPIYLAISPNDIRIRDARALWSKGNETTGRIIREKEPGGGKRSIVRIGTAGENQVAFASASVDTYRHFGRLGLGAVMGSKYLKAISVIGGRDIPIRNLKEYFKVYKDIYNKCTATEMMAKYHDAGTPINIEPLNAAGGLPTRNLQSNRFEYASEVSGQSFATKHLVRKMACTGCPVGCIHIAQFRRSFADDGYEYEAISVGYDYELIYALGTFLGIQDSQEVLELIEEVERVGLDAMSTGVVLGWATEAFAKGIITTEQTLVPLSFGDYRNYELAIEYLSQGENEFYINLGKGVKHAASVYGGENYAMNIGGNEMPGYHTGYGSLIGAAIGARHSHLCNGGYSIDQSMKEFDKEKLINSLYNEEIERCMLNSLTMCLFARKIYDRPTILAALNAIGYNYTNEDLTAIAQRNYQTKLRIKKALGFDIRDIVFPKRYFETESLQGQLDEDVAYELIQQYQTKLEALAQKG